ncbi:MAG: DUF1488 domain-containing protein [Pseudomonadota bacterium]
MSLNFPNLSRRFDPSRRLIQFWGYDSAMEVSFFVDVSALFELHPCIRKVESGYLEAFDASREQIHEAARKAYIGAHKGAYLLTASDFR